MLGVQVVLLWASIVGNLLILTRLHHCDALRDSYLKRQHAVLYKSWRISNVNVDGGDDEGKKSSGKGFGKVKIVQKPAKEKIEVVETTSTSKTMTSETLEKIDPSLNADDLIMKTDLYKR
jgi:hypothetical protein